MIQADAHKKRKYIWKNKKYTQLFTLITLFKCLLVNFKALQANNFFVGFCLNFLDFLDQQEKYATSMTCVNKLTLAVKAAFIHEIHCSEVFKILFGQQLVDRMFENKSLHNRNTLHRHQE